MDPTQDLIARGKNVIKEVPISAETLKQCYLDVSKVMILENDTQFIAGYLAGLRHALHFGTEEVCELFEITDSQEGDMDQVFEVFKKGVKSFPIMPSVSLKQAIRSYAGRDKSMVNSMYRWTHVTAGFALAMHYGMDAVKELVDESD